MARTGYLRVARGSAVIPAVICLSLVIWAANLIRAAYSVSPIAVIPLVIAAGAIFLSFLIALGAAKVITTEIDEQVVSQRQLRFWPVKWQKKTLYLSNVEGLVLTRNTLDLNGNGTKISIYLSFYSQPNKVVEHLKTVTGLG